MLTDTKVPVEERRALAGGTLNSVQNTTTTSGSTKKVSEYQEEHRNNDLLHKVFYIMAQVGGFAYCLKITVGTLLGFFSETLQVRISKTSALML